MKQINILMPDDFEACVTRIWKRRIVSEQVIPFDKLLLPEAQVVFATIAYNTFVAGSKTVLVLITNSEYVVDAIRLCIHKSKKVVEAYVVMHDRHYKVRINSDGRYDNPPEAFRKWHMQHAMSMLDI